MERERKGRTVCHCLFLGIRRRLAGFYERAWVSGSGASVSFLDEEVVVERKVVAALGVGGAFGSGCGWGPLFGVHVWWVETFTHLVSWVRCWKKV